MIRLHLPHPKWVCLGFLALAACGLPTPTPTPQPPSTLPHTQTPNAILISSLSPNPATPAPTQLPAPTVTPLGPTTAGRIENFDLLGQNALGSRGWNAGLALNYPCAYVGNRLRPHIAIVDVSDPSHPSLTHELLLAPGSQPVELRAVPDLNLLVVLNFAPVPQALTFDVSDCHHPQPLGALSLGTNGHEFFLWRDLRQPSRLLMYVATFQETGPDLVVVDLGDPASPRVTGTWMMETDGVMGRLHSLSLTPDGRRAYLALWEGGLVVADTSEFADDQSDPRLRLARDTAGQFTPAPGLNVHSAVRLGDTRYVLVTQEVYECPFAAVFIADLTDESHPQLAARFALPENVPNCTEPVRPEPNLPQSTAGVYTSHNPLVVGNLAFITWYGGGLQVLDVSDPAQPYRLGLFVPSGAGAASESYIGAYPVQLWSYPIWREGLMYVSDIQSGLYILRYTGPQAEAINTIPLAEGNLTVLPK